MRLLATFAAVATVNAYLDDSQFLQRSRREAGDEDQCAEGTYETVDGFCTDSKALAQDIAELVLDGDESATGEKQAKKFPMGQGTNQFFGTAGDNDGDLTRTKRRSQRMTLLLAKVNFGGQLVDKDGNKIRSKEFINKVNQYGCHCWPSETKEHLTGQGKPLDEIDSACWELRQCHKCISINYVEGETRPDGCDPVTTKYKAKISRDENNGLSITCSNQLNGKKNNNGDCKRSLCECDKAFAASFADSFATWSADVWKLEESQTYSDMCQRPNGGQQRLLNSGTLL